MISYTIDPTVFTPPVIPDSYNVEYKKDLKKYCDIIEKCYQFIHTEGISVYVFRYIENKFNDEYIKKTNKYGIQVEFYKKKLEDILLYNLPKLTYGEKIGSTKCYFETWFNIKQLKYSESNYEPKLKCDNSDITKRLNIIGILNNYIYKNSSSHYLIIKEKINQIFLETKNIYFSINNNNYSQNILNSEIRLESINNEIFSSEIKFKSVLEAYKCAQEHFSKYIVFGNDVKVGIDTIRESGGPPDRIYAYLETLKDFCIYKRTQNNHISDIIILQAMGCICNYENEEQMKYERVKNARMFDNGNNEKVLFSLHLKPTTYNQNFDTGNRKRTVRIYISWDESIKKVIVGWIGKHPYLPPKNI